jgi:hypothetical protein
LPKAVNVVQASDFLVDDNSIQVLSSALALRLFDSGASDTGTPQPATRAALSGVKVSENIVASTMTAAEVPNRSLLCCGRLMGTLPGSRAASLAHSRTCSQHPRCRSSRKFPRTWLFACSKNHRSLSTFTSPCSQLLSTGFGSSTNRHTCGWQADIPRHVYNEHRCSSCSPSGLQHPLLRAQLPFAVISTSTPSCHTFCLDL